MDRINDAFYEAVEIVLGNEGGYVNDPDDSGGETNFGISKRSYPDIDIKALTRSEAIEIYYMDFWLKQSYRDLYYAPLTIKSFDMSVNMGPRQANKLLQEAANTMGEDLDVDGCLGIQSINALNELDGETLLNQYRSELTDFYQNLVERHPHDQKFLEGWLKRVNQ